MQCLNTKNTHGSARQNPDEGIERMVAAVTPRHVTGVVPVLGARPIHGSLAGEWTLNYRHVNPPVPPANSHRNVITTVISSYSK
jgi:hypothetical protein